MSVLRFRTPWRGRTTAGWAPAGWPVAWVAHALSLGSLACGFLSLLAGAANDHVSAAGLVIAAVFFDGLDGAAARALHSESVFGETMDSLADLAAFGLAPAFLLYQAQLHQLGAAGALIALGYVACGTVRLARFPSTKRPHHFVGLPIPVAGAFLALLAASAADHAWAMPVALVVPLATGCIALLMVSTVEFPKFGTVLGILPPPLRWIVCLVLAPLLFVLARWTLLCLLTLYLTFGAAGAAGLSGSRSRS